MADTVQKRLFELAMRVDPKTPNQQRIQDASSAINIQSTTNATPVVVETASAHPYLDGHYVFLAGAAVAALNNSISNPYYQITRVDATHFSLNGSTAPGGAGGAAGTVVGGLVGSAPGQKYPVPQRLLDIYNEARFETLRTLLGILPQNERLLRLSGLVKSATVAFAAGVGSKPTGYILPVNLYQTNLSNPISVVSAQYGSALRDIEGPENRFVEEIGTQFKSRNADTYIADGNYTLEYIGLDKFTLTDVFGNTVTDPFNEEFYTLILEVAQALSEGIGSVNIGALIQKFLGVNGAS